MASKCKWKAYVVVKEFDMDEVNVIPSTWIVPFDDDDDDNDDEEDSDSDDDEDSDSDDSACEGMVDYKLPSRAKLGKNFKFDKNDKPKRKWPVFSGKAISTTNKKGEAQALAKQIKSKHREFDAEIKPFINHVFNRNNSYENGSGSGEKCSSEPDEENPSGQTSTEKKKTEQKNVNNLSKKIDTKELHSRCQNFYSEFNTSFPKTMSVLDSTADFLQTIISTHKNDLATKV